MELHFELQVQLRKNLVEKLEISYCTKISRYYKNAL